MPESIKKQMQLTLLFVIPVILFSGCADTNGSMIIIDAETGVIKNTYQLGGKSPVRFAFMY